MSLNEKEKWILEYLHNKKFQSYVDALDEDFVIAYIDKFDAPFVDMSLGAPKCKDLSKTLSLMYKKGLLDRFAHGVKSGYYQDSVDFKAPKWVYSYRLP